MSTPYYWTGEYSLLDFFRITATSNIYQAANTINCHPDIVRRRIVRLEQRMDKQLFIRPLGQDVRLTWHGRELLRELE